MKCFTEKDDSQDEKTEIAVQCVDMPQFANCKLIVRGKFCKNKYYSKFCCKSCTKADQLEYINDGESGKT